MAMRLRMCRQLQRAVELMVKVIPQNPLYELKSQAGMLVCLFVLYLHFDLHPSVAADHSAKVI